MKLLILSIFTFLTVFSFSQEKIVKAYTCTNFTVFDDTNEPIKKSYKTPTDITFLKRSDSQIVKIHQTVFPSLSSEIFAKNRLDDVDDTLGHTLLTYESVDLKNNFPCMLYLLYEGEKLTELLVYNFTSYIWYIINQPLNYVQDSLLVLRKWTL